MQFLCIFSIIISVLGGRAMVLAEFAENRPELYYFLYEVNFKIIF